MHGRSPKDSYNRKALPFVHRYECFGYIYRAGYCHAHPKDEYNDYKSKISKQEQKITDYEDRYYKKFSAMETALAKLQSKESAISGLFNI